MFSARRSRGGSTARAKPSRLRCNPTKARLRIGFTRIARWSSAGPWARASPRFAFVCLRRNANASRGSPARSGSASPRSHALRLLLAGLGFVPELIHRLQRRVLGPAAVLRQRLLDGAEAAREFLIRLTQRGLGVDLEMPRDVRHHEQEITELLDDPSRRYGFRLARRD